MEIDMRKTKNRQSHLGMKQCQEAIESSLQYYWGGIKELVERYFARPRSLDKDIYWIRVTLYKEIRSIPRILPVLGRFYRWIDRRMDRHIYEGIAYELADEVKHYRLLADILEWATGNGVYADQCSASPEQTRLEGLRKSLRSDLGLAPHLDVAHETVFDSIMKGISGGELEQRIARAYREIYSGETKHYRLGWKELKAQSLSNEQLKRVISANKKVARQYLIMRNELFGNLLSERRLREIDSGKVQPYRPA